MPYFTSIEPIVDTAMSCLNDTSRLQKASADLIKLVKPLAGRDAAERVAGMVLKMVQ
jgi:hypothetical protein